MKTINEQIIEKQDELIAYLIEEGTFTHFAIAGRSKIISELSELKQQAEKTPAKELSNNRQQSESSANNLKTAEEILKGEMSENLWTFICSYPVSYKSEEKLVEWIIDAMQEYAAQFRKEQEKVTNECSSIVKDLAEWSEKYPRGVVYPMSRIIMDEELVALEERAKAYKNGLITHNK